MEKHRICYFLVASVFAFILTACGGSSSDVTTSDDGSSSDDTSSSDNDSNTYLMGGSIQGEPLVLTATVSTLAGSAGTSGYLDGTGTATLFKNPVQVTTDGTSLYLADTGNHTIRQIVIASGEVSTLAGSAGNTGHNDAVGTAALFNTPYGITTDGSNLYVSETGNNTIRKIVIATGQVTTIAGSAGDTGSTDGIGTSARFNIPTAITTDGENLYVTDTSNYTIRKIVIETGEVTTLAGIVGSIGSDDGPGTVARFNFPYGITTDGTNLYIGDTANATIRQLVIATADVTTLAGSPGMTGSIDDIGVNARFMSPEGMTSDGTNLYVPDVSNHTIRKVVIATREVTTLAGSAGLSGSTDDIGSAARFYGPQGITTDGIMLYVAENGNHTIRKIE